MVPYSSLPVAAAPLSQGRLPVPMGRPYFAGESQKAAENSEQAEPTGGKAKGENTKKFTKTGSSQDSFLKLTAKEAVKNGAVIGLTLLLAPLLGPALVGAVGGAGLVSGVLFGVVVPAALEYGLNRYQGKMDHFRAWVQQQIHTPAKKILTPIGHSPVGRLFSKNPKQWLANTLDKLNPDTLIEGLKQRQAAEKATHAAKAGAKQATSHPLSPQRFIQLFRSHTRHLGWGPAMLVSLHGVLGGVRQYFSVSHQFKGLKTAFGKGIRSGLAHTGRMLFSRGALRGGMKGLRLGLFLRQTLIANTLVWGAMKGINVFAKLAYGKTVQQLAAKATKKAATAAANTVPKSAAKVVANA